jgi:hypothetical protein
MRSLVLEDTRCLAWQEVPEPQRQHEREAIVRPPGSPSSRSPRCG